MSKPYPPTPELEKVKAVGEQSRAIGHFLDWLEDEAKLVICERTDSEVTPYFPYHGGTEKPLARYFEIDLRKVEKERDAVLQWVREQQTIQKPK